MDDDFALTDCRVPATIWSQLCRLLAVLSFVSLASQSVFASSNTVASSADATISYDPDLLVWTVGNSTVQLQVHADGGADTGLTQIVLPQTGQSWRVTDQADGTLTVDGQVRHVGVRKDGFGLETVRAIQVANGVQLDLETALDNGRFRVIRHYALYDESPTAEIWTSVNSLDAKPHALSDLNAFTLTVPNGTLHWINGLQGDSADVDHETAFSLLQQTLNDGQQVVLGAVGRASEQVVPWIVVEGSRETFFAGVMWSGAWRLALARSRAAVTMNAGLAPMTTALAPGGAIDGPHAFIGAIAGSATDVTKAMQTFIVNGVRAGRPLTPLVTYNTWFAYGTVFNEDDLRREMDLAAALGTELFVMDAGWYRQAGEGGMFDFDSGLGNWTPDPDRFPSGLHALTDHAHRLGMKFGIWVEPERVFLGTVGQPGLAQESWLAQLAGGYQSPTTAQICLASPAARQWVLSQLMQLIDSVQPDYLKWDNNFWINCDRDGHGHGANDGNFAHTVGLYDVLETLRDRYPTLLIENVSGGGNRLDVGLLRYSDVAWMDDRTAPSVHVRHNVQGLSTVFPPAYLLSFAVDHDGEPLHNAPDLGLYMRSRMEGVLGLCFLSGDFSTDDAANIRNEIALYKSFRDTVATSNATLLTPQASAEGGPPWDVLQAREDSGDRIVISAFQSDQTADKTTVRPRDLDPAVIYDVRSIDRGVLGSATGADLMANGIDLLQSPASAAHVLVITAQRPSAIPTRKQP